PPLRERKMDQLRRVAAALLLTWVLTALSASRALAAPIVANQNFVRQVYLDLLGRPPDAGELAISSQLDNATLTRSQFVAAITSGGEFLSDQVRGFYQLLLHRSPSSAETNNLVNAILLGQSFEHTQAILAGGGEYFANRAGSTN